MAKASRRSFLLTALAFELGMGVVAVAIGWLVGHDPLATLRLFDAEPIQVGSHILWGIVAAVPMIGSLLLLDRYPFGPFASLKQFVERNVVPLFSGLGIADLLLLSLAAGIGEELLFRGLLQSGLQSWIGGTSGTLVALVVASIIFGVCHWLTTTYAVLATLVGVYFGVLFLWTDGLVAPLTAHAVYDFIALIYLTKDAIPPAPMVDVPNDEEDAHASTELDDVEDG